MTIPKNSPPQRQQIINLALMGPPGCGKGTYGKLLASKFNTTLITAGDVLRDHVVQETVIGSIIDECQRSGTLVEDTIVAEAVRSYLIKSKMEGTILGEEGGGGEEEGTKLDTAPAAAAAAATKETCWTERKKIGFLLDGYPRTMKQVQLMNSSLSNNNNNDGATNSSYWPEDLRITHAVSIVVPDSICTTKLLGRRMCLECDGNFNVNNVHTTIQTGDNNGSVSSAEFIMPPTLPDPPCSCDKSLNWIKRNDDTEETIRRRIHDYHVITEPVVKYYEETLGIGVLRFVPYRGVRDIHVLEGMVEKLLVTASLDSEEEEEDEAEKKEEQQ